MKELLLSFIFALVVGSMINGCSQSGPTAEAPTPPGGSANAPSGETGAGTPGAASQVLETTEAAFDADVLKSDKPVLVEFGAKWCGPCKLMAPILEELATEYSGKVKVIKVDVDENRTLSDQYAQGGLPTLILFKGGQTKQMRVGATPKADLEKIINEVIS
jgi:thioredoxin 1